MKLKLDPTKFSVGDMEDFEDYTGRDVFEALRDVALKIEGMGGEKADQVSAFAAIPKKILVGLVMLGMRLENPDASVADARRLRMDEIELDLGGGAEDPPAATADA